MGDQRRTFSWKLLGGALAALLFVGAVCGIAWYGSTADLDAMRAQARKQGVATTWSEFRPGFTVDPALITQFNRLAALSKQLKDYDSELVTGKIAGDQKRDRLRPFWPVPAAARAFHANLDMEAAAEALAILDAWPAHRLVLSDGNHKNRMKDKIGLYRQMIRWVGERVLLADDEHVFTEVRRLLHLLVQMDIDSNMDCLIEVSLISIVAPIVADQLPILNHHTEELTELITLLESRLVADVRAGLSGSFVELLPLLEKPGNTKGIEFDIFSGPNWWDSYLSPIRVRTGRAAALEIELERDRQLVAHGLGHEYVLWTTEAKRRSKALTSWNPGHWLPRMLSSLGPMMDEMALTSRLHLQVLLAEIRGEPWPTDIFDPTGQPLRRLTRDGQMIGAYSVGADQNDDGGNQKKDRQFLLFGAWILPPPPPEP